MASNEILWVVHVRAKQELNARRVLQRVIAAIGQPAAPPRALLRRWSRRPGGPSSFSKAW